MDSWEFISGLLDYLSVDSILSLSQVNKRFRFLLTREENLAKFIVCKSNIENKQKFLSFNCHRGLVKYLFFVFHFKLQFISGMERLVGIGEVCKLAGEMGNFNQVKEYSQKMSSFVAFGLCKAGRFSWLKALKLDSVNQPSNIDSILAGLASGNHYKHIEEWLSRYQISSHTSPLPLYEACKNGNLESLKILFPYYLHIGVDINDLIKYSQDHKQLQILHYLLTYANPDRLFSILTLNSELISELYKIYPRQTLYYLLNGNQEIIIDGKLILPLLDLAIVNDNSAVFGKLWELGHINNFDCYCLFIENFKIKKMKKNIILFLAEQNYLPLLQFLDKIFSYSDLYFCFDVVKYFLLFTDFSILLSEFPQSRVLKMISKKFNLEQVK